MRSAFQGDPRFSPVALRLRAAANDGNLYSSFVSRRRPMFGSTFGRDLCAPLAIVALVQALTLPVFADGKLLGKPTHREDAAAMLSSLAGRDHVVLTGVCLRDASADRSASEVDQTRVSMSPLSAAEIAWYVATGEPGPCPHGSSPRPRAFSSAWGGPRGRRGFPGRDAGVLTGTS